MKATIKYKDVLENKRRQTTIKVDRNEPNSIIRTAVEMGKFKDWDYVMTVKCGRYEYQWFEKAKLAVKVFTT